MPSLRVLVVEDSGPTRDLLERALAEADMSVTSAARYETGLRQATTSEFDVIVLDLGLPDRDGLDLCVELRGRGIMTPILCLTARADVSERVRCLDAGADDYLKKPFALAELRARLRALVRRAGGTPLRRLEARDLVVDFSARRLTTSGREVPLTGREGEVMELLVAHAGHLVTRQELLETAWHETSSSASESLDVIVSRLRRKLGSAGSGSSIRTVRGQGFVFETQP
jgi:DNA-binding response OmpR family regulator